MKKCRHIPPKVRNCLLLCQSRRHYIFGHNIYHNDEKVKCLVIGQARPVLRLHPQYVYVMCNSLAMAILSLPCTRGHKAALEKASKKVFNSYSACNNKFYYIWCSHSGFDDLFPLDMALFRLAHIYGRFGETFSLSLVSSVQEECLFVDSTQKCTWTCM
jgi:hypothetical protein